jgi:hypothetical protein
MGLMYAPQDNIMTAQQLGDVITPAPMGRFHQPVPFGSFLDLVKHRLERAGIEVTHEEYVTTADNQTFFGQMTINVGGVELDGAELTLGIRGSHNQKVPRGICLGNRVIVCSNLMFNGDLATMTTKQTTNVMRRLPAMVDSAVSRIPDAARNERNRQDAYRQFEMRPRWGDAALVEMHRRGAMSGAQLTRAINEWDQPSHEEHAEDGFNAWRLLNAVTEAQKPQPDRAANMETVRQRTIIASTFIDEVVGI